MPCCAAASPCPAGIADPQRFDGRHRIDHIKRMVLFPRRSVKGRQSGYVSHCIVVGAFPTRRVPAVRRRRQSLGMTAANLASGHALVHFIVPRTGAKSLFFRIALWRISVDPGRYFAVLHPQRIKARDPAQRRKILAPSASSAYPVRQEYGRRPSAPGCRLTVGVARELDSYEAPADSESTRLSLQVERYFTFDTTKQCLTNPRSGKCPAVSQL